MASYRSNIIPSFLSYKHIIIHIVLKSKYKKTAHLLQQINGVSEKHTYTLEALYAEWADIHYRELTPSGVQGYRTAWNYLEPIKRMKVREIKTCHFQECIDLCAEKYSRAQCEKIRQLASQLCKKAMEYDLLNKNYAQFLSLPKAQQKGRDIFTAAEIRKLKKHDSDETARIILTLIYTGFRPNELFSVTLDNVYLSKGYIIGGSKTEAGIDRRVPIHPDILPYVREWYEQRTADGKVVSLNRYLIETQNHTKMDLKNFRSRRFYPLLIELGILKYPKGEKSFSKDKPPRLTPYSTRHTFASLASCAGVKPEILQQIMGHEDYATTVNYYEQFGIDDLRSEIKKFKI